MKRNNIRIAKIILIGLLTTGLITAVILVRTVTSESFHLLYLFYEKVIFGLFLPFVNGLFFLLPNIIGSILGSYLVRDESTFYKKILLLIISACCVFGIYMLISSIPIILIGYKKGSTMIKALLPDAIINSVIYMFVFLIVEKLFPKASAIKSH